MIPLAKLGDVDVGLTAAGGVAVKTETSTGNNARLTAGVEIRKNERPRWGIKIDWRF